MLAGDDLPLSTERQAETIAKRNFACIGFIGGEPLASVAKESALKVLEMTAGKIKTISETVLGLRHGPMAALDKKTVFVCFVPGDRRRAQYARDLLCEIGQKDVTAERLAVGLCTFRRVLLPPVTSISRSMSTWTTRIVPCST